jgi:hypothetical protein
VSTEYWFPAKKYGWGWGPPNCWQGWVVVIGFVLLMLAGIPLIGPAAHPVRFVAYMTVLSLALVLVCYARGEPPKWRWGEGRRP